MPVRNTVRTQSPIITQIPRKLAQAVIGVLVAPMTSGHNPEIFRGYAPTPTPHTTRHQSVVSISTLYITTS